MSHTTLTLDDAIRLAEEHDRSGRHQEAAGIGERMLAVRPGDPALLHLAGRYHTHPGGDWNRAAACLQQVIDARPAHADAHLDLGRLQELRGDTAAALRSHRRSLALRPGDAGAAAALRGFLERAGIPVAGEGVGETQARLLSAGAHPAPAATGRLIILDRGWVNGNGHHYVVNKEILLESTGRGQPCLVYANSTLPPDLCRSLDARACLRGQHYHMSGGPSDYLFGFIASRLLRDDLRTHLGGLVDRNDTVLVHTVGEHELFGLYEWYGTLGDQAPALRVILRWPPGLHGQAAERPLSEAVYAHLLPRFRVFGDRVRFFADSAKLADTYMALAGIPVGLVPLLLQLPEPMPRTLRRDGLNVVFAGNASASKGFLLLPEVVRQARRRHPDTRFTIQCPNPGADPATIAALEAEGPAVRLIRNPLYGADYDAFLGDGDILFAVYDPARYGHATSHTTAEAASLGIPVVTTAGTSMADELHRLGPGGSVIVDRFHVDAAAAGVCRMLDEYGTRSAAAQSTAKLWRDRHNIRKFMDIVCGL